jgi:hypothetical protein
MAARTRKILHDEETRARIQTSQLVNRLEDHVFGKVDLTPTQVRGIEILLRKTIADLSATTLQGDENNPVTIRQIITGVPRAGDP